MRPTNAQLHMTGHCTNITNKTKNGCTNGLWTKIWYTISSTT